MLIKVLWLLCLFSKDMYYHICSIVILGRCAGIYLYILCLVLSVYLSVSCATLCFVLDFR